MWMLLAGGGLVTFGVILGAAITRIEKPNNDAQGSQRGRM